MSDLLGRADGWDVDERGVGSGPGSSGSLSAFAGRYLPLRSLKSGNGVDTYLAVDTLTATDVVVKTIDQRGVHAAARMRFEHETHVLRTLSGAGLTGLHDAGVHEDLLFLVQPFVAGTTLADLLRKGPLSVLDALRVGLDVATALDAAHEAGVCHRDVKPANVIVGDAAGSAGGLGAATLIDFGFARSHWLDEAIRDDLVGTVRYLAPEASGLLAGPTDERSDLYSLGVMLYESIAGRQLFPGPSVGDLLRQHLSMPVPELHELTVAVPRSLDAILQRLLRKEPVERYQSAAALAVDLDELLRALEAGDPDPRLVIGRLDRRRNLTDPTFVGREAELASLLSLLDTIRTGGSGLVLLEADSGGGKSRLLDELVWHAGSTDVAVLAGQGVAHAAQRPFTVLHGVAQDLVALVGPDEAARHELRRRLGGSATAVARALPALAGVLGVVSAEERGPEQFGEQRNVAALHQLLTSIASAERPVLLVLDDCQWADRLTVRLLAEIYPQGPPPHLGIVVAFRSEEVALDDPLRTVEGGSPVVLGPLSERAMAQLAESMAGPLPPKAVATVVRLADGSPFMGAAVMRGLVECGALRPGGEGWVVDEAALRDVQTARRTAAFLVRRLELLSEPALRVLSAGAVLGKEFDVELAVGLADEAASAAAILEEARRRRLLWVDERSGRCSFSHDKIRETLLQRLDPLERAELHGRAADALLAVDDGTDGSVFDLADHLDAASRHREALPYALRAAGLARAQHGLDAAVAYYRMASSGAADDDVESRTRIAEGLGDVLTLQGVYQEAETQFAAAHALVHDRVHAASLAGKRGDLAFKQGDIATARGHLEGAMAQVGRPVPRSSLVLVLRLLWEVLVQAAHTALPGLTTGRRVPADHDEDVLAMRLYSRLAYLYWFHSGKVPCAWAHLRGFNLAERYPPSAELAQAYSEHAPAMTMLPWFARGLRYVRRSLAIRRELDDVWGEGQSLGFTGVTLYSDSRFEEGAEACREALRLLDQTGDRWEANTAGWNLALCLYRAGQLEEAVAVARGVYDAAKAIGDQTSAGVALSVWTRACGGRVDPALITDELDHGSEDASTTSELRLAAALQALHADDLDGARAHLAAATSTIRRAGLRQEYAAPVALWSATVHRLLVERAPQHNPRLRSRQLRRAAGPVRRARFWAACYRNNAPHALREAGLLAALRGRRRRAGRLLRRSLEIAQAQGARYEEALARLSLAQLAVAHGAPVGELEAARFAVLRFEEPGIAAPDAAQHSVSLFDRFTTLLSVGRTITAAPSAEALESAIRDAALALLRGERCHVVRVDGELGEDLTSSSGECVDTFSRTLLARAVESGSPVVSGDTTAEGSESLLLSGLRSVLAAPIVVHSQAIACFYVTHGQVGELFGDEEVQLAAFIATLGGAAFEHLAGTETRFRSLAQNSSDVLTLVDRYGIVSYQSSAAGRIFALPGSGLVGQKITDWVHPDEVGRFVAALDAAATTDAVRIECRFRHADGTYLFAESAVTDLLDEPTVGALVLNSRDVTDRHRLEDEMRERALHDSLTGLPNRALFLERAHHAFARRHPEPLVACFLDLDDFKAVNDSLGHGAGDELLRAVAQRLRSCVRPQDTVARFGGDEFAILLQDTDLATATGVVRRILDATAAPVRLGDAEVVIHASIGLAPSAGRHSSADQLLAEADAAMYSAKARGSHCFDVFEPAMRVAAELRSRTRSEIDQALANQELLLHYQPIVDLVSGEHQGHEALVRWQHPQRGLLSSASFIDLAEESGQLAAIGTWVLATACAEAWHLPAGTCMSVNVSARQLQQPGFVASVGRTLQASGLRPGRLVLEITETATVADIDAAIGRLSQLKALGVQLALDDFGTGYSPLSYLRRFPVDFLKIDSSFVQGLAGSEHDRAIVRGVVDMAHAMGILAIAEGVEEAAQHEILRDLGCDLGQGFFWCEPGPLPTPPVRVPTPRLR